ncbi:GGDEF domain-containing protein [Aquabacterium sp.]|uniref:GGDEF domain-containing protein n=1 Tax=Aquabacterium sp. TaxID=1872578 RepID=UPI002CCF0428|nr:GGDEF domain-containing protein [Aquabacterium sp.]HSW07348.1 GGDEF domain-containing protein [Aquabacterium sp.]
MTADTTVILKTNEVTLFQNLGGPGARRSCLILYSGTETGKRFVLDSHAMTIGRLPNAEIYIDTPSVSRRHAELSISGDTVMIRDLSSSNGTHVNNQRVEAPLLLKDGDLIRLGKVFLKFYEHESLDALLHDRIYRMATVDAGTELFNRQYLTDALKSEVKLARLTMRPLSVIYYDLDHFKSVNDRYGHSTGDLVLKESASVVKGIVRKVDILGRLGGEEFIVVLPGTPLAEAAELAERIRTAVEAHVFTIETDSRGAKNRVEHRQTVSLGVTQLAGDMKEVKDLLDAADRLLYLAKHTGRNKVCS